jgi:hypothetical protein
VDNIRLNRLGRRITALPVGVAGQAERELDVSHASPYRSVYTEVGPDKTIRVLSLCSAREIGGQAGRSVEMDCGGEMECPGVLSRDLAAFAGSPSVPRSGPATAPAWSGACGQTAYALLSLRCEKDRTGVVAFVGR